MNPPEYKMTYGNSRFWHKGHWIQANIQQGKLNVEPAWIHLSCFGWDTAPLKDLLLDCKRLWAIEHRSMTTIYRTGSGRHEDRWSHANTRRSRSLDTIYMDKALKNAVVDDMKEFLSSESATFYAQRGIPHRRGYLFHGPPGTGKTSLSFALASYFGLNLYTASLRGEGMTDHKLTQLLIRLPSQCIVLLEDVDTVGLEKRNISKPKFVDDEKKESSDPAAKFSKDKTESTSDGVTLSGLLNAIDGVSSQEGRILVMTTNDPEALDGALVRPGRIDMQVYFGYAAKLHAQEIFSKMYTTISAKSKGSKGTSGEDSEKRDIATPVTEVEKQALEFADIVPESVFTPAEVQGFLLARRKDPKKALADAPAWRENLVEAKKSGKNIIGEI